MAVKDGSWDVALVQYANACYNIHTMGTRTGTFYKEAEDSEEVAALSDAFSDASGDMGTLDCIRYVGDTDFCIDHLQHTEADFIVEEMGAFEEDGALLITVTRRVPVEGNHQCV